MDGRGRQPPGWDETYMTAFGFTYDDLGEEGARSLEHKLRAIGLPLDTLPGFPMDMTLPPRERARRGRIMLAGNYIGPDRPVARDDETLSVVFDAIARSADPRAVPAGTTVQWDFTDADPWHVVLENGSTRAARGTAPSPGVTLRMTLDDFGDIIAEREDPRRLLLKRRVRVPRQPPAAAQAAAGVRLAPGGSGQQRAHRELGRVDRRRRVALGLGQHADRQAVTECEQHVGHRFGARVQVHDALALLGVEQGSHVVARAAQQLGELRRDLLVAARQGEQLEDERDVLGVVGEHPLERGAQQRDEVVGAAGAGEALLQLRIRRSLSRRTTSASSRSLVPK